MLNPLRPLKLSPEDLAALAEAKRKLETPSLAVELTAILGRPLEAGLRRLPAQFADRIQSVSQAALLRGLEFAVTTLAHRPAKIGRDRFHLWLSAGSGALGGALGPWSLLAELPVSTTVILAAIADIARQEGHDLSRLEIRLTCLEVFALGGPTSRDDSVEGGYWLVRASLAKTFADAAAYLARNGLVVKGAPPLVKLVATVAARLGGVFTAQAAARAVPFVSAATAAGINMLFLHYYQDIAHGHFAVKRLEQKYGTQLIRERYTDLSV